MKLPVLFTLEFLIASTERAVKTACQAAVPFVGAVPANVLEFDWGNLAGFALGGAVLSYLTSYATGAVTDNPGPSVVGEVLEGTDTR